MNTNPSTQSKARDPKEVQLSPRSAGMFGALSSDGVNIYTVRLVRGSYTCQCKGYAARQVCCHSAAASVARTCEHCQHVGADVVDFISRNDGSAFVLCSDRRACLARQLGVL